MFGEQTYFYSFDMYYEFNLGHLKKFQMLICFQLHVNNTSNVADHCCAFALSEGKEAFNQTCTDHHHTEECEQCHSIDDTLFFVSEKAKERHWENPEAILFKVV